jgi:hypothetical protein
LSAVGLARLRRCLLFFVVLVGVLGLSAAQARNESGRPASAAPQLWAVGVDRANLGTLTDRLARKARGRVNALLVDNRHFKAKQRRRLNGLVKRFGFRKIVLPRVALRSVRRGAAFCAKAKHRNPRSFCTVRAATLGRARALASSPAIDRVVVRSRRLPATKTVQMAGIHATVVVLVEIGRRRSLNGSAWRRMISQASANPSLDLAVVPVGRFRGRALAAYLELVGSTDPVAPTVPGGLTASGTTRNSITVRWSASSDNVGVAGYGRYRNGSLVSSGTATSYTFSGLACGTSYTLAVDAYDGAGNSSARASIGASTSSCSSTPPPPPPPPPGPPPPPPPSLPPVGTANLWVSSTSGSCSRQAAPGSFVAAQACSSFAAAYAAASSGDTVGVTGTLGPQLFAGSYDSSQAAGTKAITFRGSAGNLVRQVHSGSPNITYDGLNVDAGGAVTSGAAFENGGGAFVTFRNGRIGNVSNEKAALVDGSHVTLQNVVFHDAVAKQDGVHMECLYAIVVPNLTVTNSTFSNCAVMDLFFTYGDWWTPLPPPYGNVTLEGNRFETPRDTNGACCLYYGLYAGNTASPAPGSITGWTVRNNWFESSVAGFDNRAVTSSTFCGNTGAAPTAWQSGC